MIYEIASLQEMKGFASKIAGGLAGGLGGGSGGGSKRILLLDGPMGAGKTQFTRFLVEALGGIGSAGSGAGASDVASPSFAIHNQYDVSGGVVDHVDLYRLENEDELESTGFWDLFAADSGLIIIEWAERLPANCLPASWPKTHLVFEITGAESRQVTVS